MKTNEKVIAITAIVAILAAVMIMGCVDKEVSLQTNNTVFWNNAVDALDDIAYQLVVTKVAADEGEFARAKLELATVDTLLKQYISEFEEIKVAENTLPCKKALISAFKEIRVLGVYFDAYLENPTVDEYVRYNRQAVNVTNQMEIVDMLAKEL